MNDADPWSSVNRDANHASDVIKMALSETFGAVEGIDPDAEVLFEKLVGELIIVVIGLWGRHAVDLFHLGQVGPVSMLLHIVVIKQHLLTNVIGNELVRLDVGPFLIDLVQHFVFFTDDPGSRIELLQIVGDRVLDVHVSHSEDIVIALTYRRY